MGNFEETMDRFLESYTAQNGNSGYLRVTVKDNVVLERSIGYANRETKTPFCRDSLFTLYSLSKPFCALGLMKLVDRGLVKLEDHPGVYVPEAKTFHRDVTLDQILRHIGGIPDFVQTAKFHKKYPEGKAEHMRRHLLELAQHPMVSQPGTVSMYANVNYILVALVIENVSGMPYPTYMEREVFAPLGMKTARVDHPHLQDPNRVTGYEIYDGQVVAVERCLDWMLGAGDVLGTADDVYALNRAIKHEKLVSKESWARILTPTPLGNFGLGCRVSQWHGKQRIMHNGGSEGFRTLHIQLPEDDFDIIYLSNSGWGEARWDYAEAVFKAWYSQDDGQCDRTKMDEGYI